MVKHLSYSCYVCSEINDHNEDILNDITNEVPDTGPGEVPPPQAGLWKVKLNGFNRTADHHFDLQHLAGAVTVLEIHH